MHRAGGWVFIVALKGAGGWSDRKDLKLPTRQRWHGGRGSRPAKPSFAVNRQRSSA